MPRRARIHADGNWYHVFNRGARRWPIFQTDSDRRAFLALIARVVETFAIEVHGYCLMGNHYHLVLRCPAGNLSEAMHHLGQMYTQQINHHHDVDGPLFRGRFGSVPIADDAQLLTTVRYVARNPLDISGLGSLEHYRWSSHRAQLELEHAPAWLTTNVVGALSNGPGGYRSLVEESRPGDEQLTGLSSGAIQEAVLVVTGSELSALAESRRGTTNEPRLLLLLGLTELAGASTAELVGSSGFRTEGSVRSSLHRARRRRATSAHFGQLWDGLIAELGLAA